MDERDYACQIIKVKKKHQAWKRYRLTQDGKDYSRARNQARWATRSAVRDVEKTTTENV